MYEEDTSAPVPPADPVEPAGNTNTLLKVLIGVFAAYLLVSGYFLFDMHSRLGKVETDQKEASEQAAIHNAAIMKRLGMTESTIEQAAHQLQTKIGQTQKEVAVRTGQLAKQQQESEQRLSQSEQKLGAVSGELGGVKTELAGAKTDIAIHPLRSRNHQGQAGARDR